MQVKGELDINRMPEREAKRILDRIYLHMCGHS